MQKSNKSPTLKMNAKFDCLLAKHKITKTWNSIILTQKTKKKRFFFSVCFSLKKQYIVASYLYKEKDYINNLTIMDRFCDPEKFPNSNLKRKKRQKTNYEKCLF